MGRVYYATTKSTGESVAIKALRKERQRDQRSVDQFFHEATVLSGLKVPGIVGFRGGGRFPGGGYFLVLDYIAGDDLEHRFRDTPLAFGQAARIVRSLATIVQHAHDNGIIHCDLKPSNVLLDNAAQVWVTDFGFARMLPGFGRPDVKADYGGTLSYMAPEQLDLSLGPVGPQADIYGLGAILYRLLHGRFEHPRRDRKRGTDWLRSACSHDLVAIADRCLAVNPSDRFGTAKEVDEALDAFLHSSNGDGFDPDATSDGLCD